MIEPQALPTTVQVSRAFTQRLPSQRIIDLVCRLEPGRTFPEIAADQAFRLIAFRKLVEDHPGSDETSLWLHSYDVEVDVVEADPTWNGGPTATPLSAATGVAFPTTSTG
ncbi:MAG TPA: hypothetical protein VGH66_13985 [Acidimicrobiales bacterium]|jgi:hypothetical protein